MDFALLKGRLQQHQDAELGSGATNAEISAAEHELGVHLAGGYASFLRTFGWGGVEDFEIYGLGANVPDYLDLVAITKSERDEAQPPLPEVFIPLMNDGLGNLYCLDAREPYIEEYPVVFWDHEAGENQDPQRINDDFSSWLASLLDARR